MPFWAIIEAHTGNILDVVVNLDGTLPAGAIAIDLPGSQDDIRAWLAKHNKKKAGGGGRDMYLGNEEEAATSAGGKRDDLGDAEQFFARLQMEMLRAETGRGRISVLLFDLSPFDQASPYEFVSETLRAHEQELLPCDLACRLRDHLVGVLMPDIDGRDLRIVPARGTVVSLSYPQDADQLEQLRRRRHPLLNKASGMRRAS